MYFYPSEENLIICLKENYSYDENGYNFFIMSKFLSGNIYTTMVVCFNKLFVTLIPLNSFVGVIEGVIVPIPMSEIIEINYKKGLLNHHFIVCIGDQKNDFSCQRFKIGAKWAKEGLDGLINLYGAK